MSDRDPARLLALIQSLAREIRPDRGEIRVTLNSDLDRDLGFDSLGRTELLLRVERVFSVKLSESLLVEAENAGTYLAGNRRRWVYRTRYACELQFDIFAGSGR